MLHRCIYPEGFNGKAEYPSSKPSIGFAIDIVKMVLHLLLKRQSAATAPYDWILAITFIAYIFSAFGNGANDVANAYATSVAARTLTMPQVGFLSVLTEFFGAVVVGRHSGPTLGILLTQIHSSVLA